MTTNNINGDCEDHKLCSDFPRDSPLINPQLPRHDIFAYALVASSLLTETNNPYYDARDRVIADENRGITTTIFQACTQLCNADVQCRAFSVVEVPHSNGGQECRMFRAPANGHVMYSIHHTWSIGDSIDAVAPANTWNSNTPTWTYRRCTVQCEVGWSNYDTGHGPCMKCGTGKYKPVGNNVKCISCPAGKISTLIGSTSVNSCTDCPIATYVNSDGTLCVPCPTTYTASQLTNAFNDFAVTTGCIEIIRA